MTRWLPFAGLVVVSGIVAFVAGWQARGITETEVIERFAAQHVAGGGTVSECLAVPGKGRVWIEVRCAGTVYHASRFGRLIRVDRPGGPQT